MNQSLELERHLQMAKILHYAPEVIWTAVVTTPFFIHQNQSKRKDLFILMATESPEKGAEFQIAHSLGKLESKVMQMLFFFSSTTKIIEQYFGQSILEMQHSEKEEQHVY